MRVVDQLKVMKMAVTRNRKHRLVHELGMYFAEKGYVVSLNEYKRALDRPAFLSPKEIVKVMGTYTGAVDWIEKYEPELWELIHKKEDKDPLTELAQAKTGKKNG
jgi:hypothetical protein